jgi:hypothetical protein
MSCGPCAATLVSIELTQAADNDCLCDGRVSTEHNAFTSTMRSKPARLLHLHAERLDDEARNR